MKPKRCYFRIFTTEQLRDIEHRKADAANSGIPYDPNFAPQPKLIRFVTYEVPQVGDEVATDAENEAVRVRVKKRTWVFVGADESDPENVSVNLDVEVIA